MRRLIVLGLVVVLVMVMVAPAVLLARGGGGDNGKNKVKICHVPPGNPANAHVIRVSQRGADRHLANHPLDSLIDNASSNEYCDADDDNGDDDNGNGDDDNGNGDDDNGNGDDDDRNGGRRGDDRR